MAHIAMSRIAVLPDRTPGGDWLRLHFQQLVSPGHEGVQADVVRSTDLGAVGGGVGRLRHELRLRRPQTQPAGGGLPGHLGRLARAGGAQHRP